MKYADFDDIMSAERGGKISRCVQRRYKQGHDTVP